MCVCGGEGGVAGGLMCKKSSIKKHTCCLHNDKKMAEELPKKGKRKVLPVIRIETKHFNSYFDRLPVMYQPSQHST